MLKFNKPALVPHIGLFFLPESLSPRQFAKFKKSKIFLPFCKTCKEVAKKEANYTWSCPACGVRYYAHRYSLGDEIVFIYRQLNNVPDWGG